MSQDEIVEYLSGQYPNKPTQREIAKALGKSVSTVNEQLTMLERKEMIASTGKGKNKRYIPAVQAAKALSDQVKGLRLDIMDLKETLRDVADSHAKLVKTVDFLLRHPEAAEAIKKHSKFVTELPRPEGRRV